jgi:hypothetical protein
MAMRTVDLALFADIVAARSAALEARLERARDRIRQAAIEREARQALPPETVERLERIGVLSAADVRAERREVGELAASVAALRELQTWTEARVSDAVAEAELGSPSTGEPEPFGPPRAA